MKNIAELYQDVVSWIGELIMKDQIWLRDVPQKIRQSSATIYIYAFRASRSGSCCKFLSDVQVLCDDIIMLYDTDTQKKAQLIALLSDTLQLSNYKGDERFEIFKKNMHEKLLWELHNYEYAHGDQLQAKIRKYQAEKGVGGIP